MYKFIFIGTANAFYSKPDNFQSNLLIIAPNNEKLLIDCGSDARRALAKLNFNHTDITHVYISHQHSDHIGGLDWLALSSYFTPGCDKPHLYLPEPLMPSLWEDSLKGQLSTLPEEVSVHTYFDIQACKIDESFQWQGLSLTPVFSYHAPNGDDHMPCYSLWIESAQSNVFFTADTTFTPEYHQPYFEKADTIFHDCETTPHKSGVHAHYDQLKTLSNDIKKKMYLYHYHDPTIHDPIKDGFIGFAKPGITIEIE